MIVWGIGRGWTRQVNKERRCRRPVLMSDAVSHVFYDAYRDRLTIILLCAGPWHRHDSRVGVSPRPRSTVILSMRRSNLSPLSLTPTQPVSHHELQRFD